MPIYLRYGRIKGEVKKPAAYRGWIELQGIQWGVGRPLSSGRSSVGSSPSVSEILVIKQFDSSSVALQQEALTGEGTVAIIDFAKADGHVDLRCTLTDAMINSYSLGGGISPRSR